MAYKIFILFLIIIQTAISVNISEIIYGTTKDTLYDCVFHGIRCNPDLSSPCCESNNTCTKIFGWEIKRFIHACLKPALLGDSCQTNVECAAVKNSWCNQNNKCECLSNCVQMNPSKCSSLINGNCLNDEDCLILHSVCIDFKCICKRSYLLHHPHQCIPTSLGLPCDNNDDCNDLGHSECSDDKICVCKLYNLVKYNTCQPRLNAFCEDNQRCVIENSSCVHNKCQCNAGYVFISHRLCIKTTYGRSCETDNDCESMKFMKCSKDKKCICENNTMLINNATCVSILGGSCFKNFDCKVDNSVCIGGKCRCKPKYKRIDDEECRASRLGKFCLDALDCEDIWHMKCSENNACTCKENHVEVNQASCEPLLGAFCHKNECAAENSHCTDYQCQCKPAFKPVSNDYCMHAPLGEYCESNYDCKDISHLKCSLNHQCECKEYHMIINDAICEPLLSAFCETDEFCQIEHSACIDNQCKCEDHYYPISNSFCALKYDK